MIIYLHGLGSSGNSSKANQFRQLIAQHDKQIKVFTPTYSSDDAALAGHQLVDFAQILTEQYPSEELMFVGTSLGAYFARYLAEMFYGKAVLINPAYTPEQMKPLLGYNQFHQTGEYIFIGERFTANMVQYYVFNAYASTLVLLDEGDELFDVAQTFQFFMNKAKIISYPGGSHRFSHLQESMPSILSAYCS